MDVIVLTKIMKKRGVEKDDFYTIAISKPYADVIPIRQVESYQESREYIDKSSGKHSTADF